MAAFDPLFSPALESTYLAVELSGNFFFLFLHVCESLKFSIRTK